MRARPPMRNAGPTIPGGAGKFARIAAAGGTAKLNQPGHRMSGTGTPPVSSTTGVASRSRAVRSNGMHHEVKPIINSAAVYASHRGSAIHSGAAGSSIMGTKQSDMLAHRRAVRSRHVIRGRNPY